MCDYSLESVQSRPAKVGDRLTTRDFNRHTATETLAVIRPVALSTTRMRSAGE
jgi:hypothetical protein